MKTEISPRMLEVLTTHDTLETLAAIKKSCKKPGIYEVRCPSCQNWAKAWKSELNDHMLLNCKSCGFSFTE